MATDDEESRICTRGYQQEMLDISLHRNVIIALDTGAGKTHIAVLRLRFEVAQEERKISWFLAPTVALCQQQLSVISSALPVEVGLITGASEPQQWKHASVWTRVLSSHRVVVSTPQVLLDALRHGFINLGRDISLLVFDEAHHAVDNDPYNRIMQEFYFSLPPRIGQRLTDNIVRPMILGLTASPIFGGDIIKALNSIETNLDSIVCTAQETRSELAQYVHKPTFKSVTYNPPDAPFSTNLAAVEALLNSLNIEDDPYVKSLRKQLRGAVSGTETYNQLDRKLSKVISKENTFTHKGLRDFCRAGNEIMMELGAWAADWYVWEVIKAARDATRSSTAMPTWHNTEKKYLLSKIDKIQVTEPSYHADDIEADLSDKFIVLVQCLLREKEEAEERNEAYSGLVFVRRRDVVLALTELLTKHPLTRDIFQTGLLLGTSETSQRHSFIDITTKLRREPQDVTLRDFKIGEKNLIISTSVAEEGIDVQACGSVIRWDLPQNIVQYAQSRGRARKKKSTFTLMLSEGGDEKSAIEKWMDLEKRMVQQYSDSSRKPPGGAFNDDCVEEEDVEFRVPQTGALLTLQSAIPYLEHFCAIIPNQGGVDFRPVYETDPPEFPIGWHSFDEPRSLGPPYQGPFGSTVTLPRLLPLHLQKFSTKRIYPSKLSAHRHAAFMAYLELYRAELLDDNLLPLSDRNEEIEELKKEVEKRKGMSDVAVQMDPWKPERDSRWFCSEITFDGLPPLHMFTRIKTLSWQRDDGPTLNIPGISPVHVSVRVHDQHAIDEETIQKAKDWTRKVFWCLNGSRMAWDNFDFSYVFLPSSDEDKCWETRRLWSGPPRRQDHFNVSAEEFGQAFSYPDDLFIVRDGFGFSKIYKFISWHYNALSPEEEEVLKGRYRKKFGEISITYPLLAVQRFPARTNYLLPAPSTQGNGEPPKPLFFLPKHAAVVLLPERDTRYAFLLPSLLRFMEMTMTAGSLRSTLFSTSPALQRIPSALLTTALTAPVSGEPQNYQRLETLGDTVLKFVVSIQLLAEYPTWHEGYLSRSKDHSVSNVSLAKENMEKGMYRWIIRDRLLSKKWKPKYLTNKEESLRVEPDNDSGAKKTDKQEVSTKGILADVVESVIGAAYLHGGFELGYECIKFFGLRIKHWESLDVRISQLLDRVGKTDQLPHQVGHVEQILGYSFTHKLILVEALTHASHPQSSGFGTLSYERLEFLGDAVLDMIVTDYLYRAPQKYSPGHIFLRKSAMVNSHILAFLCLRACLKLTAEMPKPDFAGNIVVESEEQSVYLWQCLLHSSHQVLDDQGTTWARFSKWQSEIEDSFKRDDIFPWAGLTRLHASKVFSDMIESLLGAVYLDSKGNLDEVRRVLRTLGWMQILERIVKNNVDVLHPVSRVALYCSKHAKSVEYKITQEKGNVGCAVWIDNEELEGAYVEEPFRTRATREGVRFAAAEKAIRALHLRDVDVHAKKVKTSKKQSSGN